MERLKTPGIELISFRTPSPGQMNKGKINAPGSRWVSRTSERIGSLLRKRRSRVTGYSMLLF
jgi:hypothetical protein